MNLISSWFNKDDVQRRHMKVFVLLLDEVIRDWIARDLN